MSRIQDLIAELCPDGVEFKTLGSLGKWYGGGTPSKSRGDYWNGGTIPWVSPKDMGKRVITETKDRITEAAVRGSSAKKVPPVSVLMVVRSSILDHTFPVALSPIEVTLNQDMKGLVPNDHVAPAYLGHLLTSQGARILQTCGKTGGSVSSLDSSKLMNFRLPVPPLEVQQEIVRFLDKFTQLEAELRAELEAELKARIRQYEHYRDKLLTFDETAGGGVDLVD